MLISNERKYINTPFLNEDELEQVVIDNYEYIFGPNSIYLPKILIKTPDGFGTIPDGFAIDLASEKWYLVEAELASVESTIKYRKIYDLTWSHFPVIFKALINAD